MNKLDLQVVLLGEFSAEAPWRPPDPEGPVSLGEVGETCPEDRSKLLALLPQCCAVVLGRWTPAGAYRI